MLDKRVTLRLVVLIVLAVTAGWFLRNETQTGPKPKFDVSFWFWHSPYTLREEEVADLRKVGVERIFVRAGTFTSDGEHVMLMLPQSYGRGLGLLKTHLVFNFDSGVVRHFGKYDLATMAREVAPRVLAQLAAARKQGVVVEGVQFDLDCPTRLLPRYAELVHLIRQRFRDEHEAGLQVSTTGLMSWLGTPGLQALCKELDFHVPQAYEGVTGRNVDDLRPVSDLGALRAKAKLADDLPCSVYWGLPAYGHAFLFDETGRLENIYRGMTPSDALRHPAFRFVGAQPLAQNEQPAKSTNEWVGEQSLLLRAVRPSPDGRGKGYTLAYTIPSPELIQRHLRAARELQSPNCLGAIVYRYPEEADSMTIPLPTILRTMTGNNSPPPNLRIAVETSANSYEAIEGQAKEVPKDLFMSVENTGGSGTFVSPDAVMLNCTVDAPGVADIATREFDEVVFASPRSSATSFSLTKGFLAAGAKVHIGPIRLLTSRAKRIRIDWKVRTSNGFGSVSGSVVLALDPNARQSP